jgi:hypothetical protein
MFVYEVTVMTNAYYNSAADRNLRSEMRIARNRKRREAIVRRQITVLILTVTVIIFTSMFMIGSFMSDAQADTYEPSFKYYKSVTVHSDETLLDIADDYYAPEQYSNISEYITEICRINNIGDADMIKSGEALIVPYYSTEFK